MFTYLAEELRTGDIAVAGAGEYADWRANLLTWAECEPLLAGFCQKACRPPRRVSWSGCAARTWTRLPGWTPDTRITLAW